MYAEALRKQFPELDPVVEDLFLLEAHQIAGFPKRAPPDELAAVLRARPALFRYFCARHPPIEPFLAGLVRASPAPELDPAECEDRLVWELADMIVYQRAPAMYDEAVVSSWGLEALREAGPLEDKVVADVGAGTGQVTFIVAPIAKTVFAVEPVASLRAYIENKAADLGLKNVFVIDGLLSAIPLPAGAFDVLLTQRAVGWELQAELSEIERIVRPGGVALHLTGMPFPMEDDALHEGLSAAGYSQGAYEDGDARCSKYFREL